MPHLARRFAPLSILLVALAACSDRPAAQAATGHDAAPAIPGIRVVELFQSQGCSSCPPAIANVNAVADRPDVIALTYAVTYWDQLGWKDRFAAPAFTERQWDYARAGGRGQVFTPQVIVDGTTSIVGARRAQLDQALAATPPVSATPRIDAEPGWVRIGGGPAGTPASVWLVAFDPRAIAVKIGAGENGGRTIVHRNVVRSLRRLGDWSGAPARLALPDVPAGLGRVILVQRDRAGPILAAKRL
jgi:hypothetical protein